LIFDHQINERRRSKIKTPISFITNYSEKDMGPAKNHLGSMAAVSHANGFYDQLEYEVRLVRSRDGRHRDRLNSDDMKLRRFGNRPPSSDDGKIYDSTLFCGPE
jgi:hypothetical protein